MTTHTQVKLERDGAPQVAWIETRGAKLDALVEVKDDGLFWKVVEVWDTLPTEVVKKNERNFKTHRDGTDI